MWRSRMFWRLFGTYGLLILAAIGLLGFIIVGRVQQHFEQQIEESLRTKALLILEAVRDRRPDQEAHFQERMETLRKEIATRITLLTDDGEVIADSERDPESMENHADRPEVRQARHNRFGAATRFSKTLGQPLMYVALRTDARSGEVAFVRVALPLTDFNHQLANLRSIVWTAAGITSLAAMILAFWLARRITKPLEELTGGAERIASGNYGHKVYVARGDEIGVLARTFNHMSARLASQFSQLDEERQQLRAILSGMVEGVIALDAGERILFANERAAQLLDFQAPAAVGRKLWEVLRQRAIQDFVRRALAGSEPCRQELLLNGSASRNLTVHAARLSDAPGHGAVMVVHDTTELRRLERLRQEFVANVSHELKTPLSVIKACVETLVDGAVDDAENRDIFLDQIGEQTEHLHALILDLLSIARIESATEAFEFEQVDIEKTVFACIERHRARAEAKQQSIETTHFGNGTADGSATATNQTAGTTITAWADGEAVGQILDNLVDNAVKYTPAGGRIQVRWSADSDHVYLEVEDNGIGISERDLPRIFERFYRVDRARSRELGGTGLGLSIVKHLSQAMQGSVTASSRLGHGSTFSVRLPRTPAV